MCGCTVCDFMFTLILMYLPIFKFCCSCVLPEDSVKTGLHQDDPSHVITISSRPQTFTIGDQARCTCNRKRVHEEQICFAKFGILLSACDSFVSLFISEFDAVCIHFEVADFVLHETSKRRMCPQWRSTWLQSLACINVLICPDNLAKPRSSAPLLAISRFLVQSKDD